MSNPETVDIGINGFGSIGLCLAPQALRDPRFNVLAINNGNTSKTDIERAKSIRESLAFHSIYGWFEQENLPYGEGTINVDGETVHAVGVRDPRLAPWKDISKDRDEPMLIADATGKHKSIKTLGGHIEAGSLTACTTSPSSDRNLVPLIKGVTDSEENLAKAAKTDIWSHESCTTMGISTPVMLFDLHPAIEIESGHAQIYHAKTGSQPVGDRPGDNAAERRTADSLVPASSGSQKSLVKIFKHFDDFTALSQRLPIETGSNAVITLDLKGDVDEDTLIKILDEGINGAFKRLVAWSPFGGEMTDRKVVKSPYSSVISPKSLMAKYVPRHDITKFTFTSWFDNQWGYSCRVLDIMYDVAMYRRHHLK